MRARLPFAGVAAAGLLACLPALARAQAMRPVTLEQAIAAALVAPRVVVARADSAAARAQLRVARAFPNPDLAYDRTTSTPRNHLLLEQGLEYPWVRAARIRSASAGASAAALLLSAERAAVRHDVVVAYAGAAAAREIAGLSRRNLAGADELVRVAGARRRAGDASELDVLLAGVTAAQARNTYLTDSLAEITSLLDLQALMGLQAERVEIVLADSLDVLPVPAPGPGSTTLPQAAGATAGGRAGAVPGASAPGQAAGASGASAEFPPVPARVAAAQAQLEATLAARSEARRSRLPVPALRAGFEQGDPDQPGTLPEYGISLPLPFWNHGGGEVSAASAAVARAQATLALAQLQTHNAIARADRERALARARVERDRTLVGDAERVAQLSLTAYHEGAYPLATVLEAQRSARDALRQFVQDLAQARSAEAAYVLARTAGAEGGSPPAPAGGGTP